MRKHYIRRLIFVSLISVICGNAMTQISPDEAVAQMKRGINLGNTLEPPLEGGWNNPPASEVYFDLYQDAGFNVVRVPVRWHNHTENDVPYRVDDTWMDRVEEVVDWGLSRDLFIIINAHHDNWIKEDYANPALRARFDSIWSQIATRFRDKSERLLFEVLNEPHGLTKEQNDELHQRIVSIIRRTNPTRNIVIQGHVWGGADELIAMAIPDDNYLIGSFHTYDPWPFGLEGTGSFGSPYQVQQLDNKFSAVKSWSEMNHIPVLLGEFGCNRDADYNSRMKHYRAYVNLALTYGFTFCAWDDGGDFQVMLRNGRTWNEIKDILIFCSPQSPTLTGLTVWQDTLINLQWSRGDLSYDSVHIQRKTEAGPFSTIAAFTADTTTFTDQTAKDGKTHFYRIIARKPDGTAGYSNPLSIFLPQYVPGVRDYFLGAPHTIPGTVEAEAFDLGGEGLSYHDMDASNVGGAYRPDECVDIYEINGKTFYIGNVLPGEWVEYSVHVDQVGEYQVDVHVASRYNGGKFLLKVGDVSSDTMEIFRTASLVETEKVTFGLNLAPGEQLMRFTTTGNPTFNIDKFEFTLNTTGVSASSDQDLIRVYQENDGNLRIHWSQEHPVTFLQVVHISGTVVASIPDPMENYSLSRAGMIPGIYLILAQGEDRVFHKKFMIQ